VVQPEINTSKEIRLVSRIYGLILVLGAARVASDLLDLLLLGRWEKWKSRCSCAISKRSGKVLPLDFSAERLFPRPFYPRIVLKTRVLFQRLARVLTCGATLEQHKDGSELVSATGATT
jgi:hypothetical protein